MRYVRFTALAAAVMICFTAIPVPASAADTVISVGKPYTVEYVTPIEHAYPGLAYEPESELTDGRTASADYNDAAWVKLYRGTAARVTVDLGKQYAISEVKIGELQLKAYGVYCSRWLKVYLSDDGENFVLAGETEDAAPITSPEKKRVEFVCKPEKVYSARYVRAEFSSDVFTMVDEVTVSGGEDVSKAEKLPKDYYKESYVGLAGPLDGIKSICLMYLASNYTREMVKPYVAYVDEKGNVKDKMFDSLLFLGNPAESGKKLKKEDCERFVSNIIGAEEGVHLTALNAVIGELKGSIYDADYKYPVFISVPFSGVNDEVFGEINGKNVVSSNLENRNLIVDWYIDLVIDRFNAAGFENLELKGLYWFNEIIQYNLSTDEEEVIIHFNERAHEKGLKTTWIPYYSASGIDRLDILGFDAVCMQSGYAFDGNDETGKPLPEACTDCAAACKRFGMGMEFEADMNKNSYFDRYAQYVHTAYSEGLMTDGIMMMYQVGKHIYESAVGSASIRPLYELTYKYCSGTYTEIAPVIKSGATVTITAGDYVNGKVEIEDADTPASKLTVVNLEKPEGVYFSVTGRGVYEVDTYKSKPGKYIAKFAVSDGFQVSNTVEIAINVVAAEESAPVSEPETSEAGSADETESGIDSEEGVDNGVDMYIIFIAVAVPLAVIAAVVAVVLIYIRKKGAKQ
ncbi:MAG: DUF4855 domain-containing protein [Clostridia bacterium]|nr:DUF4855 domain-containing protein [Clostridia bacterium]